MKQTIYFSKWIFLILLVGLFSLRAYAQDDTQRKKHFNIAKSGFVIDGYDPVAYQTQKRAIKGDPSISVIYKGVKYAFTSTANRELFKSNPGKYEPAYGGWCAYAMGYSGEKVEVDPETFKIIDGKTYLFYNFYFNNTLKSWNKDEKNLHLKAAGKCTAGGIAGCVGKHHRSCLIHALHVRKSLRAIACLCTK